MPTIKDHSKHSQDLYGVEAEDLHKWIDLPVLLDGPKHRRFRHSADSIIPYKFIKEYGEDLARDVLLDHLALDKGEELEIADYKELTDYDYKNNKMDSIPKMGDLIGEYVGFYKINGAESLWNIFQYKTIPAWILLGLITWCLYPEIFFENKSILRVMAEYKKHIKRNYACEKAQKIDFSKVDLLKMHLNLLERGRMEA